MAFYDLNKTERDVLVKKISSDLLLDLSNNASTTILRYFSDDDTYVRKAAYLGIGRLYLNRDVSQKSILSVLKVLSNHEDALVRQTVINAAGEIGKKDFDVVRIFFDGGLKDAHHAPRNAVIGSVKKMGEVNPLPVMEWARGYLHHPDKEIRREICHGIELRGRKHPEDILPLLKELQFDPTARVYKTLVHVLGQIAYKKGCLEKVIAELRSWQNEKLIADALDEIIDVHERYKNFAHYSQDEAKAYIERCFYK